MRPASRPERRLFLALLALVAGAALGGCGSHRLVVPILPPGVPIYPELLNPYSVLDALRLAYQRRDTVEIRTLYDDGYQGTSHDTTTIDFTKADEIHHVATLAHDPAVVNIDLVAVVVRQRYDDAGDPPGWATIDNPFVSLGISTAAFTWRVDFTTETSQFKFVPRTPDPSSPTDTTWKIVRWSEVK